MACWVKDPCTGGKLISGRIVSSPQQSDFVIEERSCLQLPPCQCKGFVHVLKIPLDRFTFFGVVPTGDAPGDVHVSRLSIPVLWK